MKTKPITDPQSLITNRKPLATIHQAMPTYEYRCASCKHEFEAFQSMSAKPISVCPKCKKRKAKRLISAGAGLIFKGSGFYLTDYARGRQSGEKAESPKSEPAKTEASAKADAPAKAEAKTAKPAKNKG